MLENNLIFQVIVVLASAMGFLIIIEAFGFIVIRVIDILVSKFSSEEVVDEADFKPLLRLFIGGLAYTLFFFFVGVFGWINKNSVISLSILFPIAVFIIDRRWRFFLNRNYKMINQDQFIWLGAFLFLLMTFILWFRPITGFDGLWYHLTIPKLFLQNHNISDQGSLVLYSLQPSLDYFWNLWPLSLPISTAVAGIIINTIQTFVVVISLIFASQIGARVFKWVKFAQFSAPILIGGTYETFRILGIGGNDIMGLAYGITSALFCFYILQKSKISWNNFIIGVLLIVGLASIKIFFTVLASFLMFYFIIGSWDKLPFNNDHKKRLLVLSSILVVIFVATYLPWVLRSYLSTGRILDPIGQPELNARAYLEGGGTALNHWTNYIFERFYASVIPILTFVYSPLMLIGILAITNNNIKSKISNLWLIAIFGFSTTFFISIALQWRYYLPAATLIIFLGVVALFRFIQDGGFSKFGKATLTVFVAVFIALTVFRVIMTPSDKNGLPNINRDLYVSHFTSTDRYLSAKLTGSTYDYIQETNPKDLGPDEKIFIGNGSDLALHNLAYLKNPMMENHTDKKQFSNIRTATQLRDVLSKNKVRYLVIRNHKPSDICKEIGVEVYKDCDNPNMFRHELYDNKWNVDWYLLLSKN